MANLDKIKKFLNSRSITFKIMDLGGEVFTVKGVRESGVNEGEIVKTLIVRTNNGYKALAVCDKDRVDFKKVRKLFGSKSELARAKEVEKVANVPVGAVCPILLKAPLIFDERVMKLKHVNMGSGDLRCGLEMDLEDLLEAVEKYEVEDLVIE